MQGIGHDLGTLPGSSERGTQDRTDRAQGRQARSNSGDLSLALLGEGEVVAPAESTLRRVRALAVSYEKQSGRDGRHRVVRAWFCSGIA